MELVRGLANLRARHRGCAVTIGAYDGIHLGHRALIERTQRIAAQRGRRTMMVTFEPTPREMLVRHDPPARLTSFRERWRLIAATGLDAMCVMRFSESFRNWSGEEFVRFLHRDLDVCAVVVGHDFRFGHKGGSEATALLKYGAELAFEVDVMPPVLVDGERVSSSGVREALIRHDFAMAERWLGRPYSMRGRVVHGEKLGRTLGFPTANVRLERTRTPLHGIFAVRVRGVAADGGERLPGVASLGTRPTVGGSSLLLETYVFDFDGDLYGREIEVEFVEHIRDELKFDGLDALVTQMHDDTARARRILGATASG